MRTEPELIHIPKEDLQAFIDKHGIFRGIDHPEKLWLPNNDEVGFIGPVTGHAFIYKDSMEALEA